jgi:hypothetical protein
MEMLQVSGTCMHENSVPAKHMMLGPVLVYDLVRLITGTQ